MEEALIMQKVRDLYRRYRLTSGWFVLSGFLFWSLVAAAAFVAFIKITGFFLPYCYYFVVPVVVGLIAGVVYHKLRKVSLMDVALQCDERLKLKERLSTALEWIQAQRLRTPMFRALLRDTSRTSEKISPPAVFPFQWKSPVKKLSVSMLSMALLLWAPPLSLLTPRVNPQEVKIIHQEAKKIDEVARKLEKKIPRTPTTAGHIRKAEKTLKKLAKELHQPDISKRDALSKISRAQEEMKAEMDLKKKLEKTEEALKKASSQGKSEKDDTESKPFDEMSRTLRNIASKAEAEPKDPQKQKEIVKEMENAREDMKNSSMDTQSMDKAIDEAKNGQMKSAAREISKMSDQFQERQKEMDDMKDLQEAADGMEESKDLISEKEAATKFMGTRGKESKEGKGKADFGTSTTNKEEKSQEKPSDKYVERNGKEKNRMKTLYEKLYKPQRDEMASATGVVKGKLSKGPSVKSMRSRVRGAPRIGDKAQVDAEDTYTSYRSNGEDAVKGEKIPSRYKKLVRNYYDEIDPRK